MLQFLSIRDFVIVDQLDLDLSAGGFTVFTGETGAGKSILVDALSLILGARGDAGWVRQGAKHAEISAEFNVAALTELQEWLAEHALNDAQDAKACVLRRLIDAQGRSRAFINGRAAPLAQLKEVGEQLVDIHGQHAHQLLMKPDAQRALLDQHAGLGDQVTRVREAFRVLVQAKKIRVDAQNNARTLQAERERIEWQAAELTKLNPQPGEWDMVTAEHSRLTHAASLIEGAQAALESLSDSDHAVLSQLNTVAAKLEQLTGYDAGLKAVLEMVEPARIQVQEAGRELNAYLRRANLDPERLSEVGTRMEQLHSTGRKFRLKPDELPAEHTRLQARLAELDVAADLEALERVEAAAHTAYLVVAKSLTAARRKAALELSRNVTQSMQTLAMDGGKFAIELRPLTEGVAHGMEEIDFLVAGHAGVEPRPLLKVASGGELSRISLAIQVIASKASTVPTLVFDEVDSGIGGRVAEVVGRLMRSLGAERQVLAVTHLAQVAARANQQWQVSKVSSGKSTVSQVQVLDAKGRVDEIARMVGGAEITTVTRKAAKEMLEADS